MKKTLNNFQKTIWLWLLAFIPMLAQAQTNPLSCQNFHVNIVQHAICPSSGQISFDTIGLNGTKPYLFHIQSNGCSPAINISTSDTFKLSLKGGCSYTVKVTDNSGIATAFCTQTVTINDLYPPMTTPILTQIGCDVSISFTGGKTDYKYLLYANPNIPSPGTLLTTISNIAQASYIFTNLKQMYGVNKFSVEIEDVCQAKTAPVPITLQTPLITVTPTLQPNNDLSVSLSVNNPLPNTTYTYDLYVGGVLRETKTGSTSVVFTNVQPVPCNSNNYVKVKGSDCSEGTNPFYFPNLNPQLKVNCVNFDQGTAIITATKGTPPYTYKCTTTGVISLTGNFTGLVGNQFTFQITDACGIIQTETVYKPLLTINNLSADCTSKKVNISGNFSYNSNLGFVPITATCISCNPSVTLTTSGNTFTSSDLPTNFVLEIKDNCDNKKVIKDTIRFDFKSNLPCLEIDVNPPIYWIKYLNGADIGGARPFNGTGTYTYTLFGPSGNPIDTNNTGLFNRRLVYGIEYTVKLTTSCGLESYKKITLNQPNGGAPPNPTISYSCLGNVLSATISSTGLAVPASITNANGTPSNFNTPIPLGTYIVSDCNGTKTIIVDGSGAPVPTTVNVSKSIECKGGVFKHSVFVNGNALTNNGTYQLLNLSTNALMPSTNNNGKTFENLDAGAYRVLGISGCTLPTDITLVDPQKPSIAYTPNPPTCNNGTFLFQISNVNSTYGLPFVLTNSAGVSMATFNNGSSFESLPAGKYTLTGPCAAPTDLTISDPPKDPIPYALELLCTPTGLAYKVSVTNQQLKPFELRSASGTIFPSDAANGFTFSNMPPGTYELLGGCSTTTPLVLPAFPSLPKIQTTFVQVCTKTTLTAKTKNIAAIWQEWKQNSFPNISFTMSSELTNCQQAAHFTLKAPSGTIYSSQNIICQNDSLIAVFNDLQPGIHTLTLHYFCGQTDEIPVVVKPYITPEPVALPGLICDNETTAKVRVYRPSNTKGWFIYEMTNCLGSTPTPQLIATTRDTFYDVYLPVGRHCFLITDPCGERKSTETEVKKVGPVIPDYTIECGWVTLNVGFYNRCSYSWKEKNSNVVLGTDHTLKLLVPTQTKTFVVTIHSDDSGCDVVREIILKPSDGAVPQIEIIEKNKYFACFGGSVMLKGNLKNRPIDTVRYIWIHNGVEVSALVNDSIYIAKTAGKYYLRAQNKYKCFTIDSITVVIPTEKLALDATKKDIRCYQTKDGTIDLKSTGGILPYRYIWNDSIKTQNRANLPPALYSVTLTDSVGCTDIKAVNIEEPRPLTVTQKQQNTDNCDPFVKVIIQGGTPPYQVKIDNVLSQNTSDSTDLCLKEGSYTITITDNNKCDTSFNYSFKKIDLPTRENPVKICYGTVYKIGKHIYDKDGVYYDTLQSNVNVKCNLCDTIWKTTLDVLDPVIASVSADDPNDLICAGASTQLRTSASGGLGMPYTYAWSSKQNTKDITVKYRGNYIVTVTDGLGCTAVANRVIKVDSIIIEIFSLSWLCKYEISTVIKNAQPNYFSLSTYIWSNGDTRDDGKLFNLIGGTTYTVTVTDAEGCSSVTSHLIELVEDLKVNLTAKDLEICRGGTTTLYMKGTGGNPTYPTIPNYLLTCFNNETPSIKLLNETKQRLPNDTIKLVVGIGTYTVIIDDGKCKTQQSITIKPAEIGSKIIQKDSLCEGSTITLEAGSTKGKKAKSYQWYKMPTWEHIVGNDNKPLIVSIKSSYALVQENDLGCKDTAFWTVNVVAIPQIKLVGDYILCKSGDKGKMEVTHLNNVTHKYNYTWSSNNKDTSIIDIFTPKAYIVTVIDAVTRCKTIDTAIVKDISNWVPEIKQLVPFCEGKSATLEAEIGNAQAIWYKDGVHLTAFDNKSQIQVNQAGKYRVKVTKGSCIGESIDFEVKLYANPILNIVKDTMVCTKKMLMLKPTSPTAVNYLWSNGATTKNIEVPKGSYSLTVTDAIGCKAIQTINVNEHPDFIPTVEAHKQICPNDSIKIKLNGVYTTYLWSDASTLTTLIASKSGSYSVTVTNKEGCTAIATTVITDANVIKPLLESVKICPSTQGEIKITNANEFTYIKWSDGSTKSSIYFDKVTTLSVEVKDKNECPSTGTITTEMHLKPKIQLQLPTVCESKSGIITTKMPFVNYLWNDGSTAASLSVNTTGNYSVTVTDQNGCKADTTIGFSLKPNPKPVISGATEVCTGADIKLSTADTTGIATYQWTNGFSTPNVIYKQVGSYSLTVTDQNGCTGTDNIDVKISDGLKVIIPTTKPCQGEMVKLDPGIFDTYLWSNGKTTRSIDVTQAGVYQVTVTIDKCSGIGEVNVSFFDNPMAQISGKGLICKGNTTVLTTNYPTNIWSSGAINSDSITVKSGVHSVTVTDVNGCKGTTTIEIKERPEVKPEVANGASCLGTLIPLLLKDANLYSSFEWSTGEKTALINVDKADIYRITVIDTNGCIGETTASASFNPLPSVKIKGAKTTLCPLEKVDIVADTEAGNQIKWSNNLTTANIKIGQGTYFVTVTNSHGCTAMDTLTLKDVPQIEASMNIVGTKVCHGDSVFLNIKFKNLDGKSANATIKSGNDFITYNNLIKDTIIVLKPTISSIYNLQNIIINNYSCPIIFDKNQQFEVKASQLEGSLTALNPSCFGINDGKVVLKTNADIFRWNNPVYTEKELKNLTKGIYSVTLTDALNCILTKSVTLTEPEALLMETKATQTCNGKSQGEIEVTSSGGIVPFTYIVNGKKHSESLIKNLSAGQYKVITIDTKGCKSKEQILSIGTYPILTLDLSIDRDSAFIVKGDTAQIKATIKIDKRLVRDVNEEDFREFVWLPYQCSDCLELPTQSDSSGTYRLRITDKYGCKADGNIFVELRQVIHKVDAPNAVDNDNPFKLLFPHKSVRKVNVLRIFDRWGNLVYEELNFKPNEQIGWDGTFRGQKVDPAVYAWFAVVQFLDGAEITVKGDISTMLKD